MVRLLLTVTPSSGRIATHRMTVRSGQRRQSIRLPDMHQQSEMRRRGSGQDAERPRDRDRPALRSISIHPFPVLIPMVSSPLIGFAIGLVLMVALAWIFFRAPRRPLQRIFRRAQVFSAGYMAFAHGSNDAQKTMGIITLALFAAGAIPDITVPTWVIIAAATAISLGTAVGGWRIMKTMGQRVVELDPANGFAAETTAATVLLGTATLGMPVSTTHVISSAIMGVGASKGTRGVRWGVARTILVAWVLTIPAAGLVGALSWVALHALRVA
jgi:inorganic phosphate transporter, PiT family